MQKEMLLNVIHPFGKYVTLDMEPRFRVYEITDEIS
jgi:hypothetical protein